MRTAKEIINIQRSSHPNSVLKCLDGFKPNSAVVTEAHVRAIQDEAGSDSLRWRPMETVPKDGIFLVRESNSEYPSRCRWFCGRLWDMDLDRRAINPIGWFPIPKG